MKDHFLKVSGLICSSDFCIAGGCVKTREEIISVKEYDLIWRGR